MVLTSLRGGPPHVARGDLAQDLMDLRKRIEREMEQNVPSPSVEPTPAGCTSNTTATTSDNAPLKKMSSEDGNGEKSLNESAVDKMSSNSSIEGHSQNIYPNSSAPTGAPLPVSTGSHVRRLNPYSRPFLQVIMDPRASGPHTLVTLRSVYRLLDHGSFRYFGVSSQELAQSILSCKFEQTDAGADEAVEMAIADVLCLIVQQDYVSLETTKPYNQLPRTNNFGFQTQHGWNQRLGPFALMDAFNTVFVTRKTFIHSPSLCYHFEDVLTTMIETVFRYQQQSLVHMNAGRLILNFLVNQLLHTPLVGGDVLDDSTRETQITHDDTRTLCLRLTRSAIRVGWGTTDSSSLFSESTVRDDRNISAEQLISNVRRSKYDGDEISFALEEENRSMVQIIQDDLCLSLLMTGQAIWAYHDSSTNVSPGFVSLEVLSEICATLSVLWSTVSLRSQLIAQFETILTGFYTRALVLLRKRKQPTNSASFNANLIFDAEVEIILESLVDLLCLHDKNRTITDGDGGSLETMFAYYDCHMRRSDVASGIVVELCRCCGGTVNEEGDAVLTSSRSLSLIRDQSFDSDSLTGENGSNHGSRGGSMDNLNTMVKVDLPYRQVPAHLKELCAQAIMGGMKCLFREDHPTPETLLARSKRRKSIMIRQVGTDSSSDEVEGNASEILSTAHVLRDLKSKKRLMGKAAQVFNKHASRGLQFLLDSGLVSEPITSATVATFLRNGIVVGLDKKQIGAYLGEAGKSPVAGKSPPCWERDWFHKEVLKIYCSLFRFENQSLLDGLRMFLATFRLPGEAQQIDRILQAFADSCGQVCEESSSGRLRIFSEDPKRASDAAYLLSFSIIMLNTDRHNTNIREDRKMSCEAFIKNNSDYGRDITEPGKEFPPEYLAGIYDSINEEEIRTEGEGADGAMTVERWKDVLRGSTEVETESDKPPSIRDAEDLTELVLEHVWKPIMSAIGALWGVNMNKAGPYDDSLPGRVVGAQSGMLGVQGARLGMDFSLEMLGGVRKLGRIDIFRKIFTWICEYTGLLDDCITDSIERGWKLTNSIESQSAVIVALNTSREAGEDFDEDCWKRVWSILFELRDLNLIAKGSKGHAPSLLVETDADFLRQIARIEWNSCLAKGDMNYNVHINQEQNRGKKVVSVLGAFGRALFGSNDNAIDDGKKKTDDDEKIEKSVHGKETFVVWNEGASSDDEGDMDDDIGIEHVISSWHSSGDLFESRLIRESIAMNRHMDMPVTGLERVDETRRYQISPRAQVRERFRGCLNLSSLVSDSRYMDEETVLLLLRSLVGMMSYSVKSSRTDVLSHAPTFNKELRSMSMDSSSSTSFGAPGWNVPISPASEAFAEVLICELALKNKDRLKVLWSDILQDHYLSRLTSILVNPSEARTDKKIPVDPGLEKRVSGLLRLSIYAIQRADLANDILSSWKYLLPMNDEQHATSPLRPLDRHIGDGLLRIVSQVDGLPILNDDGWEGLVSIFCWSAKRAASLKPVSSGVSHGLAEDDPALQCFRSLHCILNISEVDIKVPCSIVTSLRSLVAAGGRRHYPQLSVACLDLLSKLHEKKVTTRQIDNESETFWPTCWRKIIEGIAEAAELSTDTVRFSIFPYLMLVFRAHIRYLFPQNIRQHALSVLTDLFLDKEGAVVPCEPLSGALREVCLPLAGRRIMRLQWRDPTITSSDELLAEFELCIGLIFKPFRHHLTHILEPAGNLFSIWKLVLKVLEDLAQDHEEEDLFQEKSEVIPDHLKAVMVNRGHEHLHNAVLVLISEGVLVGDSSHRNDITSFTWDSAARMGVSEATLLQWKKQAAAECINEAPKR